MCCGCPITYQSAAGKAGRKFGQHSRLRGHTYCRWNRQEGPPAAAGAHFVLALGVMSCVERSDWLRWMPCVLSSQEAFKACPHLQHREPPWEDHLISTLASFRARSTP